MKTFMFSLLVCVPFWVFGQAVDTASMLLKIDSLMLKTSILLDANQLDSGKVTLDSSIGLIKMYCGESSAKYALWTNLLGNYQGRLNQPTLAEQTYLKAIALGEKTLKPDNPNFIGMIINLAIQLSKQSRYEEAEGYFIQARRLFSVVPQYSKNPFYTTCITHLVYLYKETTQFYKEKEVLTELANIIEQQGGKNNPDYLFVLNHFGIMYYEAGQFDEAEKIYLEINELVAENFGKLNEDYTGGLINLGLLYSNIGRDKEAEQCYMEARNIYEQQLQDTTTEFYANCLYNLAILYQKNGLHDKALPLLQATNAIDEKTIGKQHPYYALGLELMARSYMGKGDFAAAKNLFAISKKIKEDALGHENPETAYSIEAFAELYQNEGKYSDAENNYLEAGSILEKTLSRQHPNYLRHISRFLNLLMETHQFAKAIPLALEAAEINRLLLQQGVRYLSEAELTGYAKLFEFNLQFYLTIAGLCYPENPNIRASCYDDALFHKGFLMSSAARIKTKADADTSSSQKIELLSSYRRRLAKEYSLPIAERDSASVAVLEIKANAVEKEVARTVAGFGEALREVKWREVQQKLQPDEASIEFIHYDYYSPKSTDSTMYAALLLRPGDSAPHFIPLFEEKSLDSLLQTQGQRRAEYVSNLYTLAERGARSLSTPQKSLYDLLWQPLGKELSGVQTIYFSPSGLLYRLNIGAIPISDGETLADRYRLVELSSTRQLVIQSEVKVSNQEALLFGGIKYEMDSTAIISDLSTSSIASRGAPIANGMSFSLADSTLRGGTWNYLKWTDKEVTALEPIMKSGGIQTTTRRGYSATEESFKAIGRGKPSPRILHIATHGFFFPDPKARDGGRGMGDDEPVFKISDHPMIRSGLILAGGNHAWQTGKPIKPDMEDGILTAYEISQMNLSNTELVVLSACETGLGDIEGNEGVYGLQRAFKIAGAKYLIMSLWQVPDYQTQELMTTFYKKWLEDKMTIPDAFQSAQKEMREKYLIPYFWAGFVLVE